MFILLITAAVNAPSLRFDKNDILSCKKKITARKIFVVRFFFKEMTLLCIQHNTVKSLSKKSTMPVLHQS